MSTLYLPRRHRRALLLPRGLVALGFLLLIGCRVLVNQPRLHRYSVMQLTMPSTPSICDKLRHPYALCPPPIKEIIRRGFWQTADFTGNAAADSNNLRLIQRHLRAVYYHSTTDGLQVRFHTRARYGSLIDALDEVNMSNAKKYFIDIYSPVTTLYVLPLHHETNIAASKAETSPIESAPTTSGVSHWLYRITSHLENQAWGTVLLAGLSIWLLVALGQWLLHDE